MGFTFALLLEACAAAPEPAPPRPTPRLWATRSPTTPSPTPTPTYPSRIDEAPIDETPQPAPPASEIPAEQPAASAPEPESMLTHISASTPPNAAASYRLIEEGRRLMKRGDDAQALQRFERSVAVDPMNAYGYYFLAQAHAQSRKYDQAIAFAGRAAALSARTDRVCEARALTLQGTVYEGVGRFADARAAYTKALRSDPRNAAAKQGVARLGGQ